MRSNGISEATACEVADTARFDKAAQVRGQIYSKHIDDSVLEQLNRGAYPGHRFLCTVVQSSRLFPCTPAFLQG
jgi:hypothetical protein